MLRVDGLHIELGEFALHDVSFKVEAGDYFVLLGASGIGKSVLLEALAGMHTPEAGRIELDGEDITAQSIQHRRLALVYQNETLFPHLSVAENIAYPLRARGASKRDCAATVRELADKVGVAELLERRPGTLSGGEAQRVSLARALAAQPKCLLLDEPLSALDVSARSELRGLLRRLHREGQTIVHVTHDYEEAISLATQVAIVEDGHIAQCGTPKEVLQHPKSEFVARFVGVRNFFSGELSYPGGRETEAATFTTNGLTFSMLSDAAPGPGYLILRSEDIVLSPEKPEGSARNTYLGTVKDVAHARLGVEVFLDIGVEMAALVTESSVEQFGIAPGKELWLTFKATAGRFIEE